MYAGAERRLCVHGANRPKRVPNIHADKRAWLIERSEASGLDALCEVLNALVTWAQVLQSPVLAPGTVMFVQLKLKRDVDIFAMQCRRSAS